MNVVANAPLTRTPISGTYAPNMGARTRRTDLGASLFGKARRAILGILFTHTDRSFYFGEIVRAAAVGKGAAQRELEKLLEMGLVLRRREGRQVYYRANLDSPVFPEIRSLMVKTSGVADVLRRAIGPLADRIAVAFIYGSMAKGVEKAESDVDVMVVGDVSFGEVVEALGKTERALGREVNPSVYPPKEFRRKARAGQRFVKALLEEPRVFIKGDDNELARLAS